MNTGIVMFRQHHDIFFNPCNRYIIKGSSPNCISYNKLCVSFHRRSLWHICCSASRQQMEPRSSRRACHAELPDNVQVWQVPEQSGSGSVDAGNMLSGQVERLCGNIDTRSGLPRVPELIFRSIWFRSSKTGETKHNADATR